MRLDQCEQVDTGLEVENGKQRFEFMFDIRTPERIFYLAADSAVEMSNWVAMICKACGFKATEDDDTGKRIVTLFNMNLILNNKIFSSS